MLSDEATETESEEDEEEKEPSKKHISNSAPKTKAKKVDVNDEKADEMEKSLDMEMKPQAGSLVQGGDMEL